MSSDLSGRNVAGYTIGALLGQGGFARVFETSGPNGDAVLKVGLERGGTASTTRSLQARPALALCVGSVGREMRTVGAAEVDATLRGEAELLRADGGRLLPRLLAESEVDERPALLIERLAGESLRASLTGGGDPDPRLLLTVLKRLADARAEGRLPYHGDLKPEHVFANGTRLIDPAFRSSEPSHSTVTPEYNPLLGANSGADVIAVAAMLYEVYVGAPPFVGAPPGFALRLIPDADEEQRLRADYAATVPRLTGRDGVPQGVASFVDEVFEAHLLSLDGGAFPTVVEAAAALEGRL